MLLPENFQMEIHDLDFLRENDRSNEPSPARLDAADILQTLLLATNLFGHILYSFKDVMTNMKMIFHKFVTFIEECTRLSIRHVIKSRNPAGETNSVLTKETTPSQ
jgi:hypothetical protein